MFIIIVDFGMGNLRSIQYKLNKIGINAGLSSRVEDIENAERLILPGVGHFATAMDNLRKRDLIQVLNKKVLEEKTPVLGICLGMQLFSKWSEEGNAAGLGWLDAETRRFKFDDVRENMRVPHVGWNMIVPQKQHRLLASVSADQRFYFTHSFHLCCNSVSDVLATTHYGYEFVSAVQKDNILGVQFHPEKSHLRGIELFKDWFSSV